MLKLENTEVLGWEHAIRGMRNPMNSWEKSDSGIGCSVDFVDRICAECDRSTPCVMEQKVVLGPNDHDLMMRLAKGGPVHAKYRRMITVYVDLTGPLYWWKEFDTYKVGTVANSCSTMHKIHAKEFTLEDFSCEHLEDLIGCNYDDSLLIDVSSYHDDSNLYSPAGILTIICKALNRYRERYLETKDKRYWWQMIQLLPSSYNQRRTVQMNYEVLANIYKSRRNHKLDEWHTFCDWIEELPYSELVTGPDLSSIPICHEIMDKAKKRAKEDIEDSVDISHLVDITGSWDVEELGGERIYAIGPGFTREDLTPYELYLLEKSEEYEKRKKEE